MDGVLVLIDYEKCFDSLSHEVLIGFLKYFNSGPNFIE